MSAEESQAFSYDLVHVCFSGMGGHYAVVRNLVQSATQEGLSSAAVIVGARSDFESMKEDWSLLGAPVYPIFLRKRRDLTSGIRAFRLGRQLSCQVLLGHSHRHALAFAIGRLSRSLFLGRRISAPSSGTHVKVFLTVVHGDFRSPRRMSRVGARVSQFVSDGTVHVGLDATPQEREIRRKHARSLAKPAFWVPNGVNTTEFAPPFASGCPPERDPDSVEVVMAARMVVGKRFADLLEAMSILQARNLGHLFHLTLLGDGPNRGILQSTAKRLKVEALVSFEGQVSQHRVMEVTRSCQVYVQASDGEAVSMSLIQAMSCAVPVVVSAAPGLSELVADGDCGLIYRNGDAEDLASRLETLLDPDLRRRLGKAARGRVLRDFSAQAMWRGYRDAVSAIAGVRDL